MSKRQQQRAEAHQINFAATEAPVSLNVIEGGAAAAEVITDTETVINEVVSDETETESNETVSDEVETESDETETEEVVSDETEPNEVSTDTETATDETETDTETATDETAASETENSGNTVSNTNGAPQDNPPANEAPQNSVNANQSPQVIGQPVTLKLKNTDRHQAVLEVIKLHNKAVEVEVQDKVIVIQAPRIRVRRAQVEQQIGVLTDLKWRTMFMNRTGTDIEFTDELFDVGIQLPVQAPSTVAVTGRITSDVKKEMETYMKRTGLLQQDFIAQAIQFFIEDLKENLIDDEE